MKTPSFRPFKLAALILALGGLAGYAAAEGHDPLSFSNQQVAGGRTNYAAKCSRCHGVDLEGGAGPALTGGGLDNYLDGSVGNLFDFLNASMPQDAPGTLTPPETATLIAYLASKNGRAAGPTALPTDKAALDSMGFAQ